MRATTALLLLLAGPPLVAQGPSGRVVRLAGGDTLAAPAAMVTLHRVATDGQGPVDSLRAGTDGRFTFVAPADTSGVLLVSARWHGVEYFAPPVGETPVTVTVADTASDAPVSVASRHLVVGGPAADGTRDVIDLLVLRNASGRTRASGHDSIPTWWMLVPPEAANVSVGDGDVAAMAFDLHGDTLFLHAPIPPGARQFFLQYQVPPHTRTIAIPLVPAVDSLTVLAEEPGITGTPALVRRGDEAIQGRQFARFTVPGPATSLVLALPGGGDAPGWLLPALIAVMVLAVLAATWRALAAREGPP